MIKYRIRQDTWGDHIVEKKYLLFPFIWWQVREVGSEKQAREIVDLLKKKPIYL